MAESGPRPSLTPIIEMQMESSDAVVYEPDERCPLPVAIGLGLQLTLFAITSTVFYVTLVAQEAGADGSYLSWAVFAALVVNGITTVLLTSRIGRIGSGHMLSSTSAGSFLAISLMAVAKGGPAMLASIFIVSSLILFALAAWLPLLRRIITPVVSGSVLILVAITILPIAFKQLEEVPEGASSAAAPSIVLATAGVIVLFRILATGTWRQWSLSLGIVAGCAVSVAFGLYDSTYVSQARWIGIPEIGWPGIELNLGLDFLSFLPLFAVVALVTAIQDISGNVAVQRGSRRRQRATDFRLVQGSINASGVGMLLGGILGTPLPPKQRANASIVLIGLSGVASRRVAYASGAILAMLALLPKVPALLLGIPRPVIGAYVVVVIGELWISGMKMIVEGGVDRQKALAAALAITVGMGIENQEIFGDLLGGAAGIFFGNGMTVGILIVILMTMFIELTKPRRRRLEAELEISALPQIDAFLQDLASGLGWNASSTERLRGAGEEALASLMGEDDENPAAKVRRLTILARPASAAVELEFLADLGEENLEERLALLGDESEVIGGEEISFRLLRHYATSVLHRKYQGLDVVMVRVDGSR